LELFISEDKIAGFAWQADSVSMARATVAEAICDFSNSFKRDFAEWAYSASTRSPIQFKSAFQTRCAIIPSVTRSTSGAGPISHYKTSIAGADCVPTE